MKPFLRYLRFGLSMDGGLSQDHAHEGFEVPTLPEMTEKMGKNQFDGKNNLD